MIARQNILQKITVLITLFLISMAFLTQSCQMPANTTKKDMKTIYDFKVENKKGDSLSLCEYQGKVLLVVNTASRCGFTPQYEELEAMYEAYAERGFEILDFPCNQFGQQAPESDEEYAQFCQLNYGTRFPQFRKIEVNGENEIALYTWLKQQKGFAGFDPNHPLTAILDQMFSKADPDYASKPDIKWNFTKFLIDRKGQVVARFEPTATRATMAADIERLLEAK